MTAARKRRRRTRLMLGIALLTLATAGVLNIVPSAAQEPPPPIAAEALTLRSVFTDDVDLKRSRSSWTGKRPRSSPSTTPLGRWWPGTRCSRGPSSRGIATPVLWS